MSQEKRRARQKLRDFQRLLSLEPGNPNYLAESGRLALILERPREAARYYLQQAEALGERDQAREALTACRAALRCDPQLGRARKYLSQLLSVVSMGGPKTASSGSAGRQSEEKDRASSEDGGPPTPEIPQKGGDGMTLMAARLGAGIRARGGDVWRAPNADSTPPPVPNVPPPGGKELPKAELFDLPPPVPNQGPPPPPNASPQPPPAELSGPLMGLDPAREGEARESGLPVRGEDYEVVEEFFDEMELGVDQVIEVHIEPELAPQGDFRPLSGALGPVRSESETMPVPISVGAGIQVLMPALFDALPENARRALFDQGEQRVYGEGAVVHRAGDRYEGPILVIRGRMSRELAGRDGSIPLPPYESGQVSGFLELVRGGAWRATGRAVQRTEVIKLPVRAMDEARAAHPDWDRTVRRLARRRLADHFLAASSLFGDIPGDLRIRFANQFVHRHFGRGDALFGSNAPVEGLHLVVAGEVDVEEAKGRWVTLGAGEFIGVVTAVQGVNAGLEAVAVSPVETLFLDPGSLAASLRVDEVRYRFERMAQRRQAQES